MKGKFLKIIHGILIALVVSTVEARSRPDSEPHFKLVSSAGAHDRTVLILPKSGVNIPLKLIE